MTELINGIAGLITAVVALLGALATLFVARRPTAPPGTTPEDRATKRRRWLLLCSLILVVVSGTIFFLRFSAPALSITSPRAGAEVTVEGHSVWFSVSGESSNIASDNSLKIYVLVDSGKDWHVQNPATLLPDGSWRLPQAWIGDASAPIDTRSTLRIMAVASRQQRSQDEKIHDYRELNPEVVSQPVVAPVLKVQLIKSEAVRDDQ
jgi:uncharacterized membrane protein